MVAFTYANEQEWHALRSKHIGASEVAALFNESPYITAWSLYQVKTGKASAPPVDETATETGKEMEPAIAALYSKRANLMLGKVRHYYECDEQPFLGASVDYEFFSFEGKPIAVEIKHVSTHAWRAHGWAPETDYMPPHIELQLIAQMLCRGCEEGRVVAFCDGEIFTFTRRLDDERTKKLAGAIIDKVADFRDRIREGVEPDPFGTSDELTMMGLVVRPDPEKELLDLVNDREMDELLHGLKSWKDSEYTAGKEVDRHKALITAKLQRASNSELVAPGCMTQHYSLKRTVSEIPAATIQRKASTRVLFTVKERSDVPEVEEPTSTIMAG